jgi:hypothetical protein
MMAFLMIVIKGLLLLIGSSIVVVYVDRVLDDFHQGIVRRPYASPIKD